MNDRIQLILKTKNISASKFADEINVQRSSISHILSGRNNPSLDFIQKILKRFPDINSDWILTGKGSMYIVPDLFTTLEEVITEEKPKSDEIINSEEDNNATETDTILKESDISSKKPYKETPLKNAAKTNIKSEENQVKREPDTKKTSENITVIRKTIERIIIFYSDKTCSEYFPD